MKFQLNWGVGIAIFYTAFVLFLLGNVLWSSLLRSDLVEENYYNSELVYQNKINDIKRTIDSGMTPVIEKVASQVILKFPQTITFNDLKGRIHFYRPSNSGMDKFYNIKLLDGNFQIINIDQIPKGLWRIKVDWSLSEENYFFEDEIYIN